MLYIVIGAVAVALLVLVVVALGMRSSRRGASDSQRDRPGRGRRTNDWDDSDDYDDDYWQRLAADDGGFGGSLSRRRAGEPPAEPAATPAPAPAPAPALTPGGAFAEDKTETMSRPSPAEILRATQPAEQPSRPDPLSDPLPVVMPDPVHAAYEPTQVAASHDPLTDPSYTVHRDRDPLTDPSYAVHRDPLTDPSYSVANDPLTTGGSWAASTPAPSPSGPASNGSTSSYGAYQVQPGWSSIEFDAGAPTPAPAAQPAPAYPDPVQSTYSLPEPGNDPLFGRYPGTYSEPLSDWATNGTGRHQPPRHERERVTSELPDYYR